MQGQVLVLDVDGRFGPFHGNGFEKALARTVGKGLRDMMRGMKAASVRSVRFRKRIKIKKINDALPVFLSRQSDDLSELEGTLLASGEAIPLIEYPNRQLRRGVSVAINASKRVLIKSAFMATMKSGHTGIFTRRTTGAHGPLTKGQSKANASGVYKVGRLPIDELFSTRVSDVFNDAGMIDAVVARGLLVFDQTFERVMPLELDKLK